MPVGLLVYRWEKGLAYQLVPTVCSAVTYIAESREKQVCRFQIGSVSLSWGCGGLACHLHAQSGTRWFVFLTVSPPLYFNVVQQKGTQLAVNSQFPGSVTRPDLSRVFLELDAGGKLVSLTYEFVTAHPHCPHPLRVGHPRLPLPFNAFPSLQRLRLHQWTSLT